MLLKRNCLVLFVTTMVMPLMLQYGWFGKVENIRYCVACCGRREPELVLKFSVVLIWKVRYLLNNYIHPFFYSIKEYRELSDSKVGALHLCK